MRPNSVFRYVKSNRSLKFHDSFWHVRTFLAITAVCTVHKWCRLRTGSGREKPLWATGQSTTGKRKQEGQG